MQRYHVVGTFHGSIDTYSDDAPNALYAVYLAVTYHDAASDFAIHAVICGGDDQTPTPDACAAQFDIGA